MIQFRKSSAQRRHLLRACVLAAAVWASEACAETYVILPLVGDHLTIVAHRRQTGSHIDANEYQTVLNADPALDDFAAKVADAVIAKTRPDAGSIAIRAGDPALYKIRDSWLDAELSGVAELISDIKSKLPPMSDARLLLITPYRDQPKLTTTKAELGSGKVSGLGFYVDTETWLRISETEHEMSRGYLGIFANFQLVLIDLETGKVGGQERVVLGATRSSAQAPDRTPWNALTAAQKMQVLKSLMKEGIEGSLPGMLSSKKM
jgi:hypothetical protein